jgi:ABC-2 type transport system permease protein
VWITGVILAVSVIGMITAEVLGARADLHVNFGMSLEQLGRDLGAGDLAQAGNALDMMQLSFLASVSIGLFFVLFFYLLGALYDDRRDRSVLFWKSLPITDTATVLSKVLSAALVAPILALLIGTVAYLAFMLLVVLWGAIHGINVLPAILAAHPLRMFAGLLAVVPVNALWALPTIGWLLLCSAWARSKPVMWAVMFPIGVIIAVGWLKLLGMPLLANLEMLRDSLARMLLSGWPGSWVLTLARISVESRFHFDEDNIVQSLAPTQTWSVVATPELWIGVVGGLALLAGAIWLRGRRVEVNT